MKLYMQHVETGAVLNASDYPAGIPSEAPDGFIWVAGEPEPSAAPFRKKTLADHLNELFEQNLTDEEQADLAPLKAAVKLELELNRPHVVKLIIQRAQVPDSLVPIRDQMLAKVNAALNP